MTVHKQNGKFPSQIACAYLLIVVFVYIYTHHIIDNYGDIIGNFPKIDVFGNYKCTINFPGCEDQYIDGWGISRMFVFMLVGLVNPHAHYNILVVSMFSHAYAYSHKYKGRLLLNPILAMTGYSIGSALCSGSCYKDSAKKD